MAPGALLGPGARELPEIEPVRTPLTYEPDPTTGPTERPGGSPTPTGSPTSTLLTWVTLLLVGELCLFVLVVLVGLVVNASEPLAYLVAAGGAAFVAGRVAGIRGFWRWLLAAILIVLVAIAVGYVLIWMAVSQIQGP